MEGADHEYQAGRKTLSTLSSVALVAALAASFGMAASELVSSPPAAAAPTCTVNWTGNAGDGLWSNPGNWSPTGVPASSADVSIPSGDSATIASASVATASLDVAANASLTVGSPSGSNGVNLNVSTLSVEGALLVGPAGTGLASMYVNGSLINNGTVTDDGPITAGNGSTTTITNNGAFTLSNSGSLTFDNGSLSQSGVLTDNNPAVASIALAGALNVSGGTICGTPPALRSTTLTFAGSPVAGPDCPAGINQNEIEAYGGTNPVVGTIPAGYTLDVSSSTVSAANPVVNNGTVELSNSELSLTGSGTFTNNGTFDVPSAGSYSDINGDSFTNAAGSNLSVEGLLVIGNGAAVAVTNHGTIGVAPGASINCDNCSSFTNASDGTLAFGIDGVHTSTANYGVLNGPTQLGGTLDPVNDNGYTPPLNSEYFVIVGTHSGNFTTVLHNATDDITNSVEIGVGVVGGAPAEGSTTTLSSTADPAVYGQPVSITATVAPASGGTPTGSVIFSAGGSIIGTQPVSTSNGTTSASITVSSLRVGSDSITATYAGNVAFNASTSAPLNQTVNQDAPTVSVEPNPASPIPGQLDNITVVVSSTSPGAGTPTGTVSLSDGATPIPGCQNLVMGPTGPANVLCPITYQSVGDHTINATYSGDTDFTTGNGSSPLDVVPAPTTTTLASSANPGPIGQPITYTATVTVNPPGTGTPTGTVTFTDGGAPISGCTDLALPAAAPLSVQCVQTYDAISGHTIAASYSSDPSYAASFATVDQTLQQLDTGTGVVVSSSPSIYGQQVSFIATVTPEAGAVAPPTGAVNFYDGGTLIGSPGVSTTSGVTTATLHISSLTAGTHSVTADYTGDLTYTASASAPAPLTVDQASTSASVSSSVTPSVAGQSVTLSATIAAVAPGAGTPTGSVTFQDGASTLGVESLSGGTATLVTSGLPVGPNPITAIYTGDSNFNGSSSTPFGQAVDQAATTTLLSSSANPATVGQPVIYTATVSVESPGGGTPTGSVSFSDGGNLISGCLNLSLPASPPFSVQCSQTYQSNAGHLINATYTGDGNYLGSGTTLNEGLSEVSTSTAITSSTGGTAYGQSVTFTATVTPATTATNNPTGTVQFLEGGISPIGSAPVSTTAGVTTATLTIPNLAAGPYAISAYYPGDSEYSSSTSPPSVPLTVAQAGTTTSLISTSNPSTVSEPVTYTATITVKAPGAGSPTGTVSYTDGGVAIPSCQNLPVPGSAPFLVPCGVTYASTGSHQILASYSGDGNFTTSSSGPLNQVVNKVSTSTAITSSTGGTVYGQAVTFTATVTPATTATNNPTGTVQFLEGGTTIIGSAPVSTTAGVTTATLTISTLTAGPYAITASYLGDSEYSNSTSPSAVPLIVVQSGTTTTLTSSNNPSTAGQSVTFTATVTPVQGANPTGTVTFYDNGTSVGTGGVSGSQAQLTTSSLGVGVHPVTATYSGDPNFQTSTTTLALQQTVNSGQATTTTLVGSSINPSTVGQTPVLSASITGGAAGAGGTVTFKDGAAVLGSATVSSGSAYLSVPQYATTYAIGTHSITATYSGDGAHLASTSAPYTQTVASPVFEDLNLGTDLATINSVSGTPGSISYVGSNPCGCNVQEYLAISPDGTRAYVLDPGTSSSIVHAVSTATGTVLASVTIPGWADDLAVSPTGTSLYVGYSTFSTTASNYIAVINTTTDSLTSRITVTGGLYAELEAIAINPTGTELFVTLDDGGVSVVNLAQGRTVANIALVGAEGIAVNPNGSAAYATNGFTGTGARSNTVSVISTATNTITRTFSGQTEPTNLTVNPAGTELYVGNIGTYVVGTKAYSTGSYVSAINLSSGAESSLALPGGSNSLAVSPDGSTLWVSYNSLSADDAVDEIATSTLTSRTTVSPDGGYAVDDTLHTFGAAPTPPVVPPLKVTTTSLPGASQGVYYSTALAATGGLSPYSWALTAGTLPAGLSLSSSGLLTGQPTSPSGPANLTFTVTDSNYPHNTASVTLSLAVAAGSTSPPPCGGVAGASAPGTPAPTGCTTGSNTVAGGSVTVTSTILTGGTVSVTAHGTGGLTVAQYTTGEPGVPFRGGSSGFDVALSGLNTFTSVTISDCSLGGATSFYWYNAAANGGTGAWQLVSPETYTKATGFPHASPACITITLSATSSPTLSQLDGTDFFGALPAESVAVKVGAFSLSGSVIGGDVAVTQDGLLTTVSGTADLLNANGQPASVTIEEACLVGLCLGTVSVTDPGQQESVTTPLTLTTAQLTADTATGQGLVISRNAAPYALSWAVDEVVPSG